MAPGQKCAVAAAEYKKAEEERQQHSREGAAASMDSAVSGPFYPEAAKEDPSSKGSLDHKPAGGSCDSSDSLVKSSVLAISSGGEVLMRSGAAGLTFEERFKMAATVNSVGLEVVQEQVKEGIVTLLQRAANQTAEAQQIFTSALAAAAAVVGVDSPHQSGPPDTLPVEDVSLPLVETPTATAAYSTPRISANAQLHTVFMHANTCIAKQ